MSSMNPMCIFIGRMCGEAGVNCEIQENTTQEGQSQESSPDPQNGGADGLLLNPQYNWELFSGVSKSRKYNSQSGSAKKLPNKWQTIPLRLQGMNLAEK